MMRANTNITRKERRELSLSDLRGVDLSSSPHEVDANRATYMRNFIMENGRLSKRHGWEDWLRVYGAVHGVYPFKVGEYEDLLLVHEGTRFRSIDLAASEPELKTVYSGLNDCRGMGFYQDEKFFYIGAGQYLTWRFNAASVREMMTYGGFTDPEKEIAYIPTTMIGISDDTSSETQKALDAVNLLTGWRKNTLYGGGGMTGSYYLDAVPATNSRILITLEVRASDSDDGVDTYTIEGMVGDSLYCKTKNGTALQGSIVAGRVVDDRLTVGFLGTEDTDETLIYDGAKTETGSEQYLKVPLTPPAESTPNITVTFFRNVTVQINKATSKLGPAFINSFTIGAQFGTNGRSDRLFLAGSSLMPNRIYYSEAEDFSYFPDTNYITVGDAHNAITDMVRMSDGTLAVMKEKSTMEPGVYYVTGEYQEFYDDDGKLIKAVSSFPVKNGYIGESSLHPYGSANLAGEQLILSENGVFGISLVENVSIVERNTFERSYPIREELLRHDLSKAVATVYKDRYYLAVDGLCFVADARYKYSANDSRSGAYHYDWWIWDNIPAVSWFELDGQLAFGTEDGRICVFQSGVEHWDVTYSDIDAGALSLSTEGIVRDTGLLFSVGDELILSHPTDFFCALLGSELTVTDHSRVALGDDALVHCEEGARVLADLSDGTMVKADIVDIDYADGTIGLDFYDGSHNGEALVALYRSLSGSSHLYVVGQDVGVLYVSETPNGAPLQFYSNAQGAGMPSFFYARLCHRTPVVAEWQTPIFDMGTHTYLKSLLAMTVTAQAVTGGRLSVGYRTRRNNEAFDVRGLGIFSLQDFSLESFTLDNDFARSYTKKCHERNFNYVQFLFRSEGEAACAIDAFTATYKINKISKGVK